MLEYVIYRGVEYDGGRYYITLMNTFGNKKGFDLLYRLLDPTGTLQDYTMVHSLEDVLHLVQVVTKSSKLYNIHFCKSFSNNFSRAVQSAVLRMKDESIKIIKSSEIGKFQKICCFESIQYCVTILVVIIVGVIFIRIFNRIFIC